MQQPYIKNFESCTEQTDTSYVDTLIRKSFKNIAPFWPLKNLIAVNPLQGLEELPIEAALQLAASYFEQEDLPEKMAEINRETIKWLQVYLNDGQATISMPLRIHGLYNAWHKLAIYDVKLHQGDKQKQSFLKLLPNTPQEAILQCILQLDIPSEEHLQFLTLMLTTLSGWAAYIKYRTEWSGSDNSHPYHINQEDYLAIRLIITTLFWPEAKKLIAWHKESAKQSQSKISLLQQIQITENTYRLPLLQNLAKQTIKTPNTPEAQMVFCIDVRSESFRKKIECTGNYQTFGFAGFFGIPVQIKHTITNESYSSCPVLFSPKHMVEELPCSHKACKNDKKGYEYLCTLKRLYQSVKYNFTTPFALVESIGMISGAWMAIRSFIPGFSSRLKMKAVNTIRKPQELMLSLDNISFMDQCSYAFNALKMIGLTSHFSSLVIFCGHGSTTQNNAYATILDCGACGGHHGANNARILAAILSQKKVRKQLAKNGIIIPQNTRFIAVEHNTTTDTVTFYDAYNVPEINKLKENLEKARIANACERLQKIEQEMHVSNATVQAYIRSQDWAQVRPEWGLARNTTLIIAPRDMTASIDLDGRCFLHSYDYTQDPDGKYLTTILTAPMIVAYWINMQYLFSTFNNVAYGAGSKITKNITGKIGTMQGNASDLMTGLPLQSVYNSDIQAYHELQRLMTVVLAPRSMLDNIILSQPILQKLFGNGWIQLASIQPNDRKIYLLNRDFTWQEHNY